jgi:aminopeptidase N
MASFWASSATASEPELADPATGREIRAQIPPHRFDHQHVRIELELLDWPPTTIPAVTTLTLDAIGTPRRLIELDAKGLDIHSVRLGRQEVPFVYQDELLSIRSEDPFHPENPFQVTISYTISNLQADGIGLSLFPSDLGSERFVLSSQGQTDHNSRWFPHRDAPDDPATTEIVVRTTSPDLHVSGDRREPTRS